MIEKILNNEEWNAFERKWRLIFSGVGFVLIVALLDLVAFFPAGGEKFLCYSIGSISVIGCLYVAKKLRNVDRVHAAVDTEILLDTHMHHGPEDFDAGDFDD
jgi:Na+/melibiose symporter-like transporter